ncbi:MAG TPA: hypothetical protein PLO63_11725 [Syntrophales bacterium]|nr:hypothetical protein [Syntrophales bacterium]
MNTDFRLSTAFFENIKTVKLTRLLGSDGVVGLLKIWTYAARHRPSGDFSCCSPEDLEIISGWNGDPSALVTALLDLCFIERTEKGFKIHDWEEHNHWAAGAVARTEKARRAAQARWERVDARSITEHCTEHAKCNAPLLSFPIHKTTLSGQPDNSFEDFYRHYPNRQGRKRALDAWNKLMKKGKVTVQTIMDALQSQIAHKEHLRNTGQFCPEWPMPATWLNGRRWEDEIPGQSEQRTDNSNTVHSVTCPACKRTVLSSDMQGSVCILCAEVTDA